MRTGSKQKLKYVIILEILRQETDADHPMLKQNHKFVNNLMRKNRQKTLKRTYCNIKSNKSSTFCNMNTLTYIAKFVTI